MTKQEVIDYFGGVQETADALKIRYQSVRDWPGDRVPEGRQYQIQILTKGALTAEAFKGKRGEHVA